MLAGLVTLLGGPLVGLFGSVVSGFVGYFEKKQQIEMEKVRFAHETNLLQLNIAARGEEMENERMMASMQADSANLIASYQHDAFSGAGKPYRWVASVLRLVRPALTVGLIALVAYLIAADIAGIEMQAVAMKILFLAEVAVSWWFADRRRSSAAQN